MATRERLKHVSASDGIDLHTDGRVARPGAWKELKNWYHKEPGRLTKRPGSTILAGDTNGHVLDTSTKKILTKKLPVVSAALFGLAKSITVIGHLIRQPGSGLADQIINFDIADTLIDLIGPGGIINPPSPLGPVPTRIAGLHQVKYLRPEDDLIVGAANMSQGVDSMFYLDRTTGELVHLSEVMVGAVSSALTAEEGDELDPDQGEGQEVPFFTSQGNDFHFIDVRGVVPQTTAEEAANSPANSFFALVTNQKDPVVAINRGGGVLPGAATLKLRRLFTNINDTGEVDAGLQMISGVQHMTVYKGAVVYGGFHGSAFTGPVFPNAGNYIAFADVGTPWRVGVSSVVQIGDGVQEAVTAVATTTVETDVQGIKGQLAVFTGRRVKIFDGLPLQSLDGEEGNPISLTNVNVGDVGTFATRSVVRTPFGLIYLGTDGVVYMIRGLQGIVPIGRALEPQLSQLSEDQMRGACAMYRNGFYKLAVPRPGSLTEPDLQFWADLRRLNPSDFDLGVKWSGPHPDQWPSVFFVERQYLKRERVLMGSSIDGRISIVDQEDVFTDPKTNRHQPAVPDPKPIETRAEGPQMDMGDAHATKEFFAVEIGIAANRPTEMDIDISVDSADDCLIEGDHFDVPVEPCGAVLGNVSTLPAPFDDLVNPIILGGTSGGKTIQGTKLRGTDSFKLVEEPASKRLVGRAATVTIAEDPNQASANSRVAISDITVRYEPIRRRG